MVLQAFSNDILGQTQTHDWFKHFKNEQTSVENDYECLGQSSTIHQKISLLFKMKFWKIVARPLATSVNIVGLSYGICHWIFNKN